jgi:LuxR family maltose regulon positive regulatory protein
MPDPWYRTRPLFGLIKAWGLFLNGKFDACKACVQAIEPYFTDVDLDLFKQIDVSLDAQQIQNIFMGLQAQIDLYSGEFTQAIQKIDNVLETLSDDLPFGIGLQGLLVQYLGLAYWLTGDTEAANQALNKVISVSQPREGPVAILTTNNLADLYRIGGQRTQAATLYRRVLQLVDENMDSPLVLATRVAHVELGHLLYEWNDLDGAEYHFKEALKLSRQGFIDLRVVGLGYYGLFLLSQVRQDVEGMVSAGQKLMQLAQDVTSSPLLVFKVVKIPLQIAQGDSDSLRHEIYQYEVLLENEFNTIMALGHLVVAEAYLALEEAAKAVTLLSRLIQDNRVTQEPGLHIKCRALLAVTYHVQGDLPGASTELKQALLLAEPESYIRSFVDNGPPMAELLQKYLADSTLCSVEPAPSPEYVRKLLAAFDSDRLSAAADTSNQSLVDPLTERELEVLSLIASDLSNQEIADTLIISKNTLKTHIKNIYDKLDAHSRLQAVTKAQELNLL